MLDIEDGYPASRISGSPLRGELAAKRTEGRIPANA